MNEAPVLPPERTRDEVDQPHERAARQALAWEAHDQVTPRPLGRPADERFRIGVTADHAVHDHRVGRLHVLAVGGNVVHPVVPAVLETRLAHERARLRFPVRRELDVHGPGSAGLQELDLERADTAADLEHGRSLDTARAKEVDDPLLVVSEPFPAVTAGLSPRRLLTEERVVAARNVAAAAHVTYATMRASRTLWSASRTGASSMRSKISW
jgi:hypothetical protein